MTRARQQLYLLYTFRRSSWEGSSLNLPSRFLEDIPPHLLNHAGAGGTRAPDYRQVTTWGPTPPRVSQEVEEAGETVLQFRAGMRVRHPSFGEGIVLNSRANGTDEEVSVVFEDVGIKRLMVSFARLIPIEG
jgi:DNA helicase-2/ATP-dependent DNA helicase PcrA